MSKAKLPTHYGSISEKAFTAQVIKLAQYLGWRTAHFRPAMTKRGRWVTAVQGDGAGFPDLVLVKQGKLIFAELKAEKGRLSEAQDAWVADLANCETSIGVGVMTYVWRPSDIEEIEEVLRGLT
jgi:hypothetical protein